MSVVTKLENKIKQFIDSLTSSQKYIFLSAIIIGLMAHGFALFNRLSVHDNSHCLFTIGATYEVNRWMLGIIYKLQVFTTKTFSLPLFNGFLSIIFVACAGMILVKIFDIKSKLLAVIMGGLMITFPMVTSSFSFMFTTWPYFMGLLFVFQAVYTLTRKLTIKNLILSSFWLSLCLGLYQAFLGVAITLFLLKMLVDVIDARINSVADYAKTGVAYLVELILGLGIWYGIGTVFRTVKHIELETYKGWDEGYSIAKFPAKLVGALKSFLSLRMEVINALRYLRMLALLIFIIAVVMIIILLIKSQAKVAVRISAIVGVLFMPVGMVIVYLLSTSDSIRSLSLPIPI